MLVKLNSLLGSNGKIRSSLVAIPDTYNIAQGQLTQIPISSLLENDYDRNDLIPLTFVSIQNVKGGNAVRNGNYIDYTHTGEIGEPTSFDYTISNSQGDMATTKVTLNVFSGIIANNDTYSVYSGYSRTINKSNILLNDSETNGNIPLVIIDIVNIVGGSVEETDTTITFTATAGAGEIAKFDYIVENSIGQQEMATVFFTVLTVPELIANTDGPYDIYAGLTYTVSKAQLLSNDSDPTNSTPLDITEVFDEINGSVIIDGNNIVFTSSGNAGDPASFKYIMSNSLGMTAQGLVEFNVLEVPPLIANTDVYEVQQGEEIIISKSSLIANDQTNFPPITFIDSINPINGTINETTNTVRFLSTGVWGQPAGFQYRITDDVANQATGNVNITILQLPPIEAYL
ncbi:MAG: Ig-like domain-containing protein, partial [Candidimonas sp.]